VKRRGRRPKQQVVQEITFPVEQQQNDPGLRQEEV
jgi:hypothetical protein